MVEIALNTWAISLMIFGTGIVKWKNSEFDGIERKTRKVMTISKEQHPRNELDRFYVSMMEGGRRLIRCKMCVKAAENSFGSYVKHDIEPLIIAVRTSNTVKVKVPHKQKSLSNKIMKKD